MKLNQGAKTMAIAGSVGTPRVPRTLKIGAFESLGGQVGHQRAMTNHLDIQDTTVGAPSEPKKVPKEDHFWSLFWRCFWIA